MKEALYSDVFVLISTASCDGLNTFSLVRWNNNTNNYNQIILAVFSVASYLIDKGEYTTLYKTDKNIHIKPPK